MKLVFKAEFRKLKRKLVNEPLSLLPMLFFLYTFFWIITLSARFIGGETDMSPLITHNMMGYIVWFFTISAVGAIPQTLQEERAVGTYEHLNLSVVNVKYIFLARSIVNSIHNIFILVIFVLIISLVHSFKLLNFSSSLLVLLLSIPGLYGFAFILTALLLKTREIGSWLGLLNFLIIIPAIIQSHILPPVLRTALTYWPVYQAANVLRLINLNGLMLSELQTELIILLTSSLVFFVLGIVFFDLANKSAKKRGVLGIY
ncbi:hypothetical protein [Anaerobranca gottschalkii]|uniref:ABC-2 type transport system permease protein n=1 Tax=Anaerobranca gottschalkii DSM 13577 TaxID=1120990 RepID=A0A1I0CC34_9FIRM|nr:hypothetical protein [Anaerobranca gottschalkii]SET17070.1 ABC-2 type transport system permease protein [Anaerobranca gottschalkii DSM 13577]